MFTDHGSIKKNHVFIGNNKHNMMKMQYSLLQTHK